MIKREYDARTPWNWRQPEDWIAITTIDMHTGGEPLRVVTGGLPPIAGNTVLEKRRYFREHLDHLRTGLMLEPRGHANMYGAILTASDDADFDVFFLHNEGYSTMCGHAIIALTKLVIESGGLRSSRVTFNVPAGRIEATAAIENGRVTQTSFRNVPSFVYLQDQTIGIERWGAVNFDIAYGGAFYAIVDATALKLNLEETNCRQLSDAGRDIKHGIMKNISVQHPSEPDLSFLYGVIFTGAARSAGIHSRNVCIFADGELDRSATGSGVSARAALLYAKGRLPLGESILIESVLGTTMAVQVLEEVKFGSYKAVVPEVSGSAHFTGRSEFFFDPEDGLSQGFMVR